MSLEYKDESAGGISLTVITQELQRMARLLNNPIFGFALAAVMLLIRLLSPYFFIYSLFLSIFIWIPYFAIAAVTSIVAGFDERKLRKSSLMGAARGGMLAMVKVFFLSQVVSALASDPVGMMSDISNLFVSILAWPIFTAFAPLVAIPLRWYVMTASEVFAILLFNLSAGALLGILGGLVASLRLDEADI